jgi:hypothetical protein
MFGGIWSANMIQFYVDDPTQPFFVATATGFAFRRCLAVQQFG